MYGNDDKMGKFSIVEWFFIAIFHIFSCIEILIERGWL